MFHTLTNGFNYPHCHGSAPFKWICLPVCLRMSFCTRLPTLSQHKASQSHIYRFHQRSSIAENIKSATAVEPDGAVRRRSSLYSPWPSTTTKTPFLRSKAGILKLHSPITSMTTVYMTVARPRPMHLSEWGPGSHTVSGLFQRFKISGQHGLYMHVDLKWRGTHWNRQLWWRYLTRSNRWKMTPIDAKRSL